MRPASDCCELVVPDAGPLITLAYADRLDLLLAIGLKVVVVDTVKIELTRHLTPTSEKILAFLEANRIEVAITEVGKNAFEQGASFKKNHAGERAVQDFLFEFSERTDDEQCYALLLFEDHKIAGSAFVLPDNVYVLSTKAFLLKLQEKGIIPDAGAIIEAAIHAGRSFSQKEVDKPPKADEAVRPF